VAAIVSGQVVLQEDQLAGSGKHEVRREDLGGY